MIKIYCGTLVQVFFKLIWQWPAFFLIFLCSSWFLHNFSGLSPLLAEPYSLFNPLPFAHHTFSFLLFTMSFLFRYEPHLLIFVAHHAFSSLHFRSHCSPCLLIFDPHHTFPSLHPRFLCSPDLLFFVVHNTFSFSF